MGTEIERKFLVINETWRGQVAASERMSQGYLCNQGNSSVRVRISGGQANLNIKRGGLSVTRQEYEYPIPLADAEELLAGLRGGLVEKTRYHVRCGGHLWDLDVFEGANAGLIMAEIELSAEDEAFEMPAWAGREVSGDARYYNINLIDNPYSHWREDAGRIESRRILISIPEQRLRLFEAGRLVKEYPISSGANGPGEQRGSGCTPRGLHRIRLKVGRDATPGSVFVGRRATGEVYCQELCQQNPQRDWILSRILWLTGAEPGRNRGGEVDTLRRFIYIHGTPDSEPLGEPRSHGCIRMRNADVIDLFERVANGDWVEIQG